MIDARKAEDLRQAQEFAEQKTEEARLAGIDVTKARRKARMASQRAWDQRNNLEDVRDRRDMEIARRAGGGISEAAEAERDARASASVAAETAAEAWRCTQQAEWADAAWVRASRAAHEARLRAEEIAGSSAAA